jgi:hypothetical protein
MPVTVMTDNASFIPDDKSIVFCSDRAGSFELYRMSLAQGDVVQLSGRAQASGPSDTSNESPEHVVRGYLEAFKALDATRMVSFWAEGAQVRRDGTLEPVNRDQADMRGFERATHTI